MIGKEKVLSKYYDYYMSLNLKNYYAKHCYRVASYALLCGNKEIASKYLKKSISNDPFYLKSYIVYLIVNIFGIDVFFKISKIKNRIYKYVWYKKFKMKYVKNIFDKFPAITYKIFTIYYITPADVYYSF